MVPTGPPPPPPPNNNTIGLHGAHTAGILFERTGSTDSTRARTRTVVRARISKQGLLSHPNGDHTAQRLARNSILVGLVADYRMHFGVRHPSAVKKSRAIIARSTVSTYLGELELQFFEQLCVSLVHASLRQANPSSKKITTGTRRSSRSSRERSAQAGLAAEIRSKTSPSTRRCASSARRNKGDTGDDAV